MDLQTDRLAALSMATLQIDGDVRDRGATAKRNTLLQLFNTIVLKISLGARHVSSNWTSPPITLLQ